MGIGNLDFVVHPNKEGERVVVFGAGMIGQSFIQAFKAECNCEVAAVDMSDFRLELAKQSGADYIINPSRGKSAYETMAEIWGYGEYPYHAQANNPCGNATIAVECTGNVHCVNEALDIVTGSGKVCLAGSFGDDDIA